MVLSAVFNQKVAILSYSNKIVNVINDLHLCRDYYNVTDLNGVDKIELDMFEKLHITDEILKKAEKQFEGFERKFRNRNE